jgi:DNA-binding transcriptional regulator WhiA
MYLSQLPAMNYYLYLKLNKTHNMYQPQTLEVPQELMESFQTQAKELVSKEITANTVLTEEQTEIAVKGAFSSHGFYV